MSRIQLTEHAQRRMQQRAISQETIDLVLDYGRRVHDHRGSQVCFLDKLARRRISCMTAEERRKARAIRAMDAYVVVASDGAIVTVGHRTERIRRN